MIKLDDNLLQELGLGSLPPEEKKKMLAHIYETLEMRVGMALAKQMNDGQLNEFEQFINRNDEAGALRWLETNFPNYKDVVAQEFEKLKAEIKQAAPQILASNQQQAAMPAAAPGMPPAGYPQQPMGQQPGAAYQPQPAMQPQSPQYHPQQQPQGYAPQPQMQPGQPQPVYPPAGGGYAQPAGYGPAPGQQPQPQGQPMQQPYPGQQQQPVAGQPQGQPQGTPQPQQTTQYPPYTDPSQPQQQDPQNPQNPAAPASSY